MDELVFTKALEEGLQKQLPEVVGTVLDAKMAPIKEQLDDQEKSIAEFNKTMKAFNNANDSDEKLARKSAVKATGAFFKELKRAGKFSEMNQEIKTAFLTGSTDADGGYMVPNELAKEVMYVAANFGIARKFCRIFPMGTDTKDITTIVSGVTVYRVSQGVAPTQTKPTYGQCELIAKKMMAWIGSANELIEDNMTDVEVFALISQLIGEAIGVEEDTQVLTGDGTVFTGVLNLTDANINTLATGSTTYAKVTMQDLITVVDSIKDKYLKNGKAMWFMDKSTWSGLKAMVRKWVSSDATPITQTTNALLGIATETVENGVVTRMLLGYPVYCALSGFPTWTGGSQTGKKFIAFGDLYHYALGDRRQLALDIGLATGDFESDRQSIRAKQRVGGKAIFGEAFAVLKTASS